MANRMIDRTPQLIPTPTPAAYFEYSGAAREARLTAEQLGGIVAMFERDYPYDVMLRELHVLRACNAIRRGSARMKDVLDGAGEKAA